MDFDPESMAVTVADRVFRDDLSAPGYAALDLGPDWTPDTFAGFLEQLAAAISSVYLERYHRPMTVVPQGRFDQQRSTLPHRDGGPERSILLLGYEPTEVGSRLFLLDFTRCACEQGLHPRKYLNQVNPMGGGSLDPCLERETHEALASPSPSYRILAINNSDLGPTEPHAGMLGVLHQAQIDHPDPTKSRVIHSYMLSVGEPTDPSTQESPQLAHP